MAEGVTSAQVVPTRSSSMRKVGVLLAPEVWLIVMALIVPVLEPTTVVAVAAKGEPPNWSDEGFIQIEAESPLATALLVNPTTIK